MATKAKVRTTISSLIEALSSALSSVSETVLTALLIMTFVFGVFLLYRAYDGYSKRGIQKPVTNTELSDTSVKVVRSDGRSGGSGVILRSNTYSSQILTNKHVCRIIENGGLVITEHSTHAVVSFTESTYHDLCLVTVAADLGVNTTIAKKAPEPYSLASVSGHPGLMPNVVTRGHFSGKQIIEILTGFRPCEDKDLESDDVLLCFFLGGIPQITRYEAQVVSATIQPGSSGSAVFNDRGEIAGIAFAGSGPISTAYVVPYEFVAHFLDTYTMEQEFLPNNTYEVSIKGKLSSRGLFDGFLHRLDVQCKNPQFIGIEQFSRYCKIRERDLLWRN